MRHIQGLKWARALDARPACIPQGRPRGVKALGVRYERALAKALGPKAQSGQWFEFEDALGHGYCQTDILIVRPQDVIVLECKFSWTLEGHLQLENLYRPIIEVVYGRKALLIQVCKNLRPGAPQVRADLVSAIQAAAEGRILWHVIDPGRPLLSVPPRIPITAPAALV